MLERIINEQHGRAWASWSDRPVGSRDRPRRVEYLHREPHPIARLRFGVAVTGRYDVLRLDLIARSRTLYRHRLADAIRFQSP